MIFLYTYLALSVCLTLGTIVPLVWSDMQGKKDIKLGYNFSYQGKFQINQFVWILLILTLPIVNLWFLYATICYRFKFGKWS